MEVSLGLAFGAGVRSFVSPCVLALVHWHLAALGVRPDAQRRGVGRALLKGFLECVDAGAAAAYLETGRPHLLGWYGAGGFSLRERVSLPGGRTAWTMWRPPMPAPRRLS